MGNLLERASWTSLPDGVKQINDSVYELYRPDGEPEFYIIFFHGLQPTDAYTNAFWTTWSSDGRTPWPRTMLSKIYPKACMLSISYVSSAEQQHRDGRDGIFSISETLFKDIFQQEPLTTDLCRLPFVLVGHSLGGLVVKRLIMHMHVASVTRILRRVDDKQFLKNLKGIFYYATPHGGSLLADYAHRIPGSSPVLILLRSLSANSQRINQEFIEWRRRHYVPTYSVYETEASAIMGMHFECYPEAFARRDSDGYYAARANHFTICRPRHVTESTFQKLDYFIFEIVESKVAESRVTRMDYMAIV